MGVKKSISANPRLLIVKVPLAKSSGESRFEVRVPDNRHEKSVVRFHGDAYVDLTPDPDLITDHACIQFGVETQGRRDDLDQDSIV